MLVKRAGEIAFVLDRRTDHCANGILQFAAEVHLPSLPGADDRFTSSEFRWRGGASVATNDKIWVS